MVSVEDYILMKRVDEKAKKVGMSIQHEMSDMFFLSCDKGLAYALLSHNKETYGFNSLEEMSGWLDCFILMERSLARRAGLDVTVISDMIQEQAIFNKLKKSPRKPKK
jgi:hypothetical protein